MENVQENIAIKIFGKEVSINSEVHQAIIDAIKEHTVEKEVIIKSTRNDGGVDSIATNIVDKYYNAKKYEYISTSSYKSEEGAYPVIYKAVEEAVNANSTPRDYQTNMETAVKVAKYIIKRQNEVPQNDDTWSKDFQTYHKISDNVMEDILKVVNESSTDESNKPWVADAVMDAIQTALSEA